MLQTKNSFSFQNVIEIVEGLPIEEQEMLVEIIHQRLVELRRKELIAEVREAREAYTKGEVRRGTVTEVIKEIDY
jgi:hypothetical protein